MTSIFSFVNGEEAEPDSGEITEAAPEPVALAPPDSAPSPSVDFTAVLDSFLAALSAYLPDPISGLPAHNVNIIELTEKPLSIGNLRGLERRDLLSQVVLKGGRLDALARFEIWGSTPTQVNNLMIAMQSRLLAARDELWTAGFLRFAAENVSTAFSDPSVGAWNRTADYRVLYEYHYEDTDGAESLIARIPVHTDPEERESLQRETFTVIDEMTRWDDLGAPTLEVRGPTKVDQLSLLTFLPDTPPTGPVQLLRTFAGASDPPSDLPDLGQFIVAITDPVAPTRNAQVTFATFNDFLLACDLVGDPLELGDWDEDDALDIYEPRRLVFSMPIPLPSSTDRLQLAYQPGSEEPQLDQVAVVYIRAGTL